MKKKLKEDLNATQNIINGNYKLVDSKLYRPIYPWTNERIDIYTKDLNLDNKSILTVTSSFDHALYAIYQGATNIDCFDANKLCKYYADLKQALILYYDEETVKRILEFKLDDDNFQKFRMRTNFSIKHLKDYFILPESYYFWSTILKEKSFKFHNYRLFRRDGNPSYNLPSFPDLKKKLETTTINFSDFNIENIDQELEHSHKYDAIFLSNILDCYSSDNKVFQNVFNRLNQNGLLFDYSIKKTDRSYSIEPTKSIICSRNSKQLCKIYQKK